jgi:hypothetical protein
MANAVVILGAGASADFGVPTLRGIFKDRHARAFLTARRTFNRRLNEIFWEPRGHTVDTSDQSLTIEEMLTILRDWEQEPTCCDGLDAATVAALRRNLYVLIQRAVFEGKSTRPQHLNSLIDLMTKKFDLVTWASFNWDCVFEASYWYCRHGNPKLAIDLDNWHATSRKNEFLKLHGGINWWKIGGRLHYLPFGRGGELTTKWTDYADNNAEGEPVILEPSVYKYGDDNYNLLKPQWERFFERLCASDYVLILGYSLPEADSQARSKITVAFQVNPNCRWLLVDPSDETCRRYGRLLGRNALKTFNMGLVGFTNDLRENLQAAFPAMDFS